MTPAPQQPKACITVDSGCRFTINTGFRPIFKSSSPAAKGTSRHMRLGLPVVDLGARVLGFGVRVEGIGICIRVKESSLVYKWRPSVRYGSGHGSLASQ